MDKTYIYIKDKKYEKIENSDGTTTLIHITKTGFKKISHFTNDIDKHNEAIKALGEFYVKARL